MVGHPVSVSMVPTEQAAIFFCIEMKEAKIRRNNVP